MNKQDKFIAWFLLFQAVAGSATVIWLTMASGPSTGLLVLVAPILMALVAGIGSLRGFPWSQTLGIAVFAIQVPAFQTPWFFYAVWLGVHLNITFGWTGAGTVGINLIALGMLLWAIVRRRAPNNSFKPNPLRGSA